MANHLLKHIKGIKSFLLGLIVPIISFLLFRNLIDVVISTILVKPLLSFCYPANWVYDASTLFLVLFISVLVITKMGKSVKFPSKWIYVSLVLIFIYLYYRSSTIFIFTPFSFTNNIKLLDFLAILPFIFLVINIFNKKKQPQVNYKKGFLVDESLDEGSDEQSKINDILKRKKFAKLLAEKIKNTTTQKSSFPIGISAEWGAGKTTFLNSLSHQFDEQNWLKINFNVWLCASSNQITETFFKLLRKALEPYSFSINNKLKDYTKSLLKSSKSDLLNAVKELGELVVPIKNLEEQYEEINKEIKEIGNELGIKILIFIDDLDRLDKKEIYEVIRLIRNTANFSNIFFVVAYDRNYVLNAIEEINAYKANFFLEKIFQLEFVLPPIEKSILQNEIIKNLDFLNDESKVDYDEMIGTTRMFPAIKTDLTSLFIKNLRDVVRFINSIKLSYDFIKDDIYFPDYYNLELIRFKHPEIFIDFYRKKGQLLSAEKTNNNSIEGPTYSLKAVKPEANNLTTKDSSDTTYELENYLVKSQKIYKLSNVDITNLVLAYNSIFLKRTKFNSNTTLSKSHLSVILPSMFDRYFVINIDGRLSEKDFSNWRQLPQKDFNEELKKQCADGTLIADINNRFQQIKDFDSSDDFEKIVTAIFYFADLPNPVRHGNLDFITYNYVLICNLLNDRRTLELLYDSHKENLKKFIIKLITTSGHQYRFANQFLHDVKNENVFDLSDFLSEQELHSIILGNFEAALSTSKNFSSQLWYFFSDCVIREKDNRDPDKISTEQLKLHNTAIKKMLAFVTSHDLDEFIRWSIIQDSGNGNYTITNRVKILFDSFKNIINFINEFPSPLKYREEFNRFYELSNNDDDVKKEGVPAKFFKDIPIDNHKI